MVVDSSFENKQEITDILFHINKTIRFLVHKRQICKKYSMRMN